MLLQEIVKSILTESAASSFFKFYNELGRGYDPDDAVLFDCLMTLKEYYESYMKWYEDFPEHKKTDVEVIPHFQKRLNEILIALQSDDKKRKIIAIDNGINQWHIDMPIIRHLQMGCEDGGEDIGPEEKEWMEVEDLLIKLGKLTPRKQGPYKRIYEVGWGGFTKAAFYWVSKDGKAHKVASHGSYANLLSGDPVTSDEAYQWMFDRGWARVTIEDDYIYINTSLNNTSVVNLSKAQKDWVKDIMYLHSSMNLKPVTIHRRAIEI